MLTRKRKRELKELIPRLPQELWEMVADQVKNSVDWLNLILTVPMLVSYSLRAMTQKKMKTKFTIVSINSKKVKYSLPNGVLHNTTGPALICCDRDRYKVHFDYINDTRWIDVQKNAKLEIWYKDGKRHREGGPATIEYFSDGTKSSEIWCENGKPYRKEDYPIEIRYDESGNKSHERWVAPRFNGKATEIHYYSNGKKMAEYWRKVLSDEAYDYFDKWRDNEYVDREDGPAVIRYYPNGHKKEERWVQNNVNWRPNDLPSWTNYRKSGVKEIEQWTLKTGRVGRENGKSHYTAYDQYGVVADPTDRTRYRYDL